MQGDYYQFKRFPRTGNWVVSLHDESYAHKLTRNLKRGERIIDLPDALTLTTISSGTITDITITAEGLSVFTDRAKEAIELVVASDVQFLPAVLSENNGRKFYIMNITRRVDCVVDDFKNPMVIDPTRIASEKIFRVPTRPPRIVLSEEVHTAILDNNLLTNGFWKCLRPGDDSSQID